MEAQIFPSGAALKSLLDLQVNVEIDDLLSQSLNQPLLDLLSRPKKDLRGQLVQFGFQVAHKLSGEKSDSASLQSECSDILELLHAGSLIIDDIEDGTQVRRGKKTLHLEYGLGIALNAGNWLYFLPFEKISKMPISPDRKQLLSQECQKTLLRAHYGQALDVGTRMDRIEPSRVWEVTMATMELKSGALAGFALKMGAILLGLGERDIAELDSWGRRLGRALQMFDDVGNLSSRLNPEKRAEDLRLLRPSFVFAVATRSMPAVAYQDLIQFLRGEPEKGIEKALALLQKFEIPSRGKFLACAELKETNDIYQQNLNLTDEDLHILKLISEKLVCSYD